MDSFSGHSILWCSRGECVTSHMRKQGIHTQSAVVPLRSSRAAAVCIFTPLFLLICVFTGKDNPPSAPPTLRTPKILLPHSFLSLPPFSFHRKRTLLLLFFQVTNRHLDFNFRPLHGNSSSFYGLSERSGK